MYQVEIETNPGSSFTARSRDYEFIIDTKGKGITPPDTLLAGLGGCIGVYIRKYASGANLIIEEFTINVKAEFCEDPPVRFKVINVFIDLKGVKLDERRQKALLDFVKNCPVHNTLKSNPLVEVNIV